MVYYANNSGLPEFNLKKNMLG